MKNQSARRKACPTVTLSTTDFTQAIFPMDLGHYGKKMVTNHHTVTRQVFPDKSNDQMIRVLSTSSSQRKDVQEDGVYYLGT